MSEVLLNFCNIVAVGTFLFTSLVLYDLNKQYNKAFKLGKNAVVGDNEVYMFFALLLSLAWILAWGIYLFNHWR
jgi:hypothetical protein